MSQNKTKTKKDQIFVLFEVEKLKSKVINPSEISRKLTRKPIRKFSPEIWVLIFSEKIEDTKFSSGF